MNTLYDLDDMQHKRLASLLAERAVLLVFALLFAAGATAQPEQINVPRAVLALEQQLQADTLTEARRVDVLNELSYQYFMLDNAKSEAYAQQALTLSQLIKNPWAEIRARRNLGNALGSRYRSREALVQVNKALDIALAISDRASQAKCLHAVGLIYLFREEHEKAVSYFKQALSVKDAGDFDGVNSTQNIAKEYLNLGMIDSAIVYVEMAEKIAREFNVLERNNPTITLIKGKIYSRQGRWKLAEKTLLDVDRQLESMGDFELKIENDLRLGELYAAWGNGPKALAYLEQCIAQIGKYGGRKKTELAAWKALGQVHAQIGNFQEAYRVGQVYNAKHDSLYQIQLDREIAELESIKRVEEQENLNKLLMEQQQKLELEADNRQRVLVFSFVVLALLGILTAMIYIGYRVKERANRLLVEKNNLILQQKLAIEEKSKELQKANEARFFSLVNHTSDLILAVDHDLRLSSFNHTFAEAAKVLYRKTPQIGDSMLDFVAEENREQVEIDSRAALANLWVSREFPITTTKGEAGVAEANFSPILLPESLEPMGATIVIRDITERKKRSQELLEMNQRLGILVRHLPIILWSTDNNGIFTLSEGKALSVLGLQPGQVVGMSIYDLYQAYPERLDMLKKVLSEGKTHRSIDKVGECYFDAYVIGLKNENNEVEGLLGISVDVTERVLLEQENRDNEEKLRQQNYEIIETRQQMSEYKLMALRSVMNPHFLFNSLNSIQYFISKNERKSAIEYLSFFSKLIRKVLNSSMHHFTSLSEEIELIRYYVALEQLRFEDKFTCNIDVPTDISPEKLKFHHFCYSLMSKMPLFMVSTTKKGKANCIFPLPSRSHICCNASSKTTG